MLAATARTRTINAPILIRLVLALLFGRSGSDVSSFAILIAMKAFQKIEILIYGPAGSPVQFLLGDFVAVEGLVEINARLDQK